MSKIRVKEITSPDGEPIIINNEVIFNSNVKIEGSVSGGDLTESPGCKVFLIDSNQIYEYDLNTNTKIDITSSFIGLPNGYSLNDITHLSFTKIWLLGINEILEFNITSWVTFRATYSRKIIIPTTYYIEFGLTVKNINTLIVGAYHYGPNNHKILELDISPASINGITTANVNIKFNLPRPILGDLHYVYRKNKLICITYTNLFPNPNRTYITQYDYSSGIIEVDSLISIFSAQGLFSTNNNIYIQTIDSPGFPTGVTKIQKINLNPPYNLTLVNTISLTNDTMVGASSDPQCQQVDLSTQPIPDPNQTRLTMNGLLSGNTKTYFYIYGTDNSNIIIPYNSYTSIEISINGMVIEDNGKDNLTGEGFVRIGQFFQIKNNLENNVTIENLGLEYYSSTNKLLDDITYGFDVDNSFENYSELKFYIKNEVEDVVIKCNVSLEINMVII